MKIVLIIFFFCLAALGYYIRKKKKFNDSLREQFPMPPMADYFLGHLNCFENDEQVLTKILEWCSSHGRTFLLFYAAQPTLMVSDGNFAREILDRTVDVKNLSKGYDHEFRPWLGNSILLARGSVWERRRKTIAPAFDHHNLQCNIWDVMLRVAKQWVTDEWRDREIINVPQTLSRFSLQVIGLAGMDYSFQHSQQVTEDFKQILTFIEKRSYHPIPLPNWFYTTCTSDGIAFSKCVKRLQTTILEIIKANRAKVDQKRTLLSLLLQTKDLSDSEIVSELMTFLFAGHETTSTALSWTIFLLSQHPYVSQKAFEEIRNVAGADTQGLTYENVQNLSYLNCIIQESLRLYPPQPAFVRKVEEPISVEGKVLPKGLEISIIPFAIHRDPASYIRPLEFIPERWSKDKNISGPYHVEKPSKFHFLPFSGGLRNCIGRTFAMLELRVALSVFINKFDFELVGDPNLVKPVPAVTLRSTDLKVRLCARRGKTDFFSEE